MTPNDYYEETIKKLDKELLKDLLFVEIGTASGTTAIRAIKALGGNKSKRWLFSIDPYGDKPYVIGHNAELTTYNYNDDLYRDAMADIKCEALRMEVNHTHWHMRSQDFMKIFESIEFWSEAKKQEPKFGFAFLDGEHAWPAVGEEFRYFYHRMPSGGVIIIDDYNLLDGDEQFIKENFAGLPGVWVFHTEDEHYRAYFTKM